MKNNNSVFKKAAIVLPSLDPDEKFLNVVSSLIEAGFEHIVIVDDGSDMDHQKYFTQADENEQVTVIHHGINKGKGRALKTAFGYIIGNMPEVLGAVTIDGDGQHLTKDIIACGELMLDKGDKIIIGCRDFDQPGVPARSVTGNKLTSKLFDVVFKMKISDTQTGLRAIPRKYLSAFCGFKGERFEYETNMLLQMQRRGIGYIEQPIETVYDPDDYSSHYDGVKDTIRVGKVMAGYLLSGGGR